MVEPNVDFVETRNAHKQAFIDFIVLHDAKLKAAEDGGKREIVEHIRTQINNSFKKARGLGFFANEIEVGVNDCLEKENRFWFFPETAQERSSFDEIILAASDILGAEKTYNTQLQKLRVIFGSAELAKFSFARLRHMLRYGGFKLSLNRIKLLRDIALYEDDVDENLTNLFGRAIANSDGGKNRVQTRQYIETKKKFKLT